MTDKLDNDNIDLNNILQFDLLRKVLENLMLNQRELKNKVDQIETIITQSHLNQSQTLTPSEVPKENFPNDTQQISSAQVEPEQKSEEQPTNQQEQSPPNNNEENKKEEQPIEETPNEEQQPTQDNKDNNEENKKEEQQLPLPDDHIPVYNIPAVGKDEIIYENIEEENKTQSNVEESKKQGYTSNNSYNELKENFEIERETIAELTKRVTDNENKITLLLSDIEELKTMKVNNNDDESSKRRSSLSFFDEDMKNFEDKVSEKENQKVLLENLSRKVDAMQEDFEMLKSTQKDVNIYEMFKAPSQSGDNNFENNMVLIQSIEEKMNKQFKPVEKRLKSNEQDIVKIKGEFSSLKNFVEFIKKNFNALKSTITKMNSDNISTINQTIEEKLKKKIDTIKSELEKVTPPSEQSVQEEGKNQNEQNEKEEKEQIKITNLSEFAKYITTERVNILLNEQKTGLLKIIASTEKSLKKFVNDLNNKMLTEDLENLKKIIDENLSNFAKEIGSISKGFIDSKKLTSMNIKDIQTIKDEISFLRDANTKKDGNFEALTIKFSALKEDFLNSKKDQLKELNLSRFVTNVVFDEKLSNFNKKLSKINRENENTKKNVIDAMKIFQNSRAITEKDLQTVEQYLLNELEELNNNFLKKFVDREDLQKALKIFEAQIKKLSERAPSSKEGTANDKCMLTKRSLYHCASCDSFVDALNEQNNYLPWKNLPGGKEKGTHYRKGQGFSHMLSILSNDINSHTPIEEINKSIDMKPKNCSSGYNIDIMNSTKIIKDLKSTFPRIGEETKGNNQPKREGEKKVEECTTPT